MAREESDREDLLREATALAERVELQLTGSANSVPQPVVVGFRENGALSFYFAAEPAYHFNSQGELRRAYFEGQLIKANKGELISMQRVRANGQVQLQSQTLRDEKRQAFDRELISLTDRLRASLEEGNYLIVGQVPENVEIVQKVCKWLDEFDKIRIAASPNVC